MKANMKSIMIIAVCLAMTACAVPVKKSHHRSGPAVQWHEAQMHFCETEGKRLAWEAYKYGIDADALESVYIFVSQQCMIEGKLFI